KSFLKVHDIFPYRIEDAAIFMHALEPLGACTWTSKHSFEHHTRIDFHWKRRRRGFPGDRVHVRAAICGIATADPARKILRSQFERWKRRVLTDLVRNHLVNSYTGPHVFSDRLEGNGTAQPRGDSDGMTIQRIAKFGNQRYRISKWLQRLQ